MSLEKIKSLVVLSGGMDSATALANEIHFGFDASCISFNYGSKHNDREYASALKIANHYGVDIKKCDIPFMAENFASDLLKSGGEIPEGHYADPTMKKTVVPFRNGIMLSIAAGYAESIGAERIVIGNHFGDHAIYPDCRVEFIEAMNLAIIKGTYSNVYLVSTFGGSTKTDIAKRGHALSLPYELTYSCYNGRELHCGKCGTCYERKEAFRDAGIEDPTEYEL